MQDIINQCELSQGGVYRFFKNLDEIIAEVIIKIRKEINFIDKVDAIFDQEAASITKLIHRIFDVLSDYLETYLLTFCKIDFDISLLAINEPERMKTILQKIDSVGSFEHLTNRTITYLFEQDKQHRLHARIPMDQLIAFIVSSFSGIQMECICAVCYSPHQNDMKESFQPRAMMNALKSTVIYLLGENDDEEL